MFILYTVYSIEPGSSGNTTILFLISNYNVLLPRVQFSLERNIAGSGPRELQVRYSTRTGKGNLFISTGNALPSFRKPRRWPFVPSRKRRAPGNERGYFLLDKTQSFRETFFGFMSLTIFANYVQVLDR